jgi:hypothetical protein
MDYYNKYLKYKNKYIELKNLSQIKQKGGDVPYITNINKINRITDIDMEQHLNPIYGCIVHESGFISNNFFLKQIESIYEKNKSINSNKIIFIDSKESNIIKNICKIIHGTIQPNNELMKLTPTDIGRYITLKYIIKIKPDIIEQKNKKTETNPDTPQETNPETPETHLDTPQETQLETKLETQLETLQEIPQDTTQETYQVVFNDDIITKLCKEELKNIPKDSSEVELVKFIEYLHNLSIKDLQKIFKKNYINYWINMKIHKIYLKKYYKNYQKKILKNYLKQFYKNYIKKI